MMKSTKYTNLSNVLSKSRQYGTLNGHEQIMIIIRMKQKHHIVKQFAFYKQFISQQPLTDRGGSRSTRNSHLANTSVLSTSTFQDSTWCKTVIVVGV